MRNITPDMALEFQGSHSEPAILIEMIFDTGPLRFWTGLGTLDFQGEQWLGGGNLIGLSQIDETQDLQAKGLVASLSGIPTSLLAVALGSNPRGRPFRLYLAAVDTRRYLATEDTPGRILLEDGSFILLENDLIDNPYRIFAGLMDRFQIADGGDTASISLFVESNLLVGQRPKIERYTAEDQRKRFPGDKGLDGINKLQDQGLVW